MGQLEEQLVPWEHDNGKTRLKGWMSLDCGQNNRPVIHFLHGNGLPGASYWPFLRPFCREFDLFLNSIEGHGGSSFLPPAQQNSSWNGLMQRSLAALEHYQQHWQSGTPVIGMGHSFGAIATILMIHFQNNPFSQYVLLDPVIYPKSMVAAMRFLNLIGASQYLPHVRQAKNRRTHWPSRVEVKNYLQERGVFRSWHAEALEHYIEHGTEEQGGQWTLRCPSWLEARIFSGYPKQLWSALGSLPPYSHIVHSTRTYSFIPVAVRKAEQANPHITVSEVEGGHCFMHEYPEESYRLVRRLLQNKAGV